MHLVVSVLQVMVTKKLLARTCEIPSITGRTPSVNPVLLETDHVIILKLFITSASIINSKYNTKAVHVHYLIRLTFIFCSTWLSRGEPGHCAIILKS